MNILKNLLFSYKGKIGRADYIYGLVYSSLLFFVSIDVFINGMSIYLIGGGIDKGMIIQYLFSLGGLVLFFWSFFAITTKRLRALGWDPRWSMFTIIIPPLLFLGILPDKEKYAYKGGLTLADHIFFYALIISLIISLFFLYRLTLYDRFILFLIAAISLVLVYLFWYDTRDFKHLPGAKYTGIDVWIDLGFVLIIVFFVRSYILSPFQIIGPSMESTFHGGKITYSGKNQTYSDGEFILVDKMSYKFGKPNRGDVVVFTPGVGPEKRYLIKRIIGIPGDTVKIENGFVYIAKSNTPNNFIKLDESVYLEEKFGYTCLSYSGANCAQESKTFPVPSDRYFLMGDNRPQSLDARKCFSNSGCIGEYPLAQYVDISHIQGRVSYSLGHFDLFHQLLPYPKLGSLSGVIPYRGLNIKNFHTYPELN